MTWITKNGRHVQVNQRSRVRSSDLDFSTTYSSIDYTAANKIKTLKSKPIKKWYEEGWRSTVYQFPNSQYAVDFGNFGNGNFSFVVRKGKKEIFSVPKYLLKNAVSYGLATIGVPPGIPFDLPIGAIEIGLKLYDQFAN